VVFFKLKHLAEINTYRIFSFQKLRQKPLLTIFQSFLFVIGAIISGFVLLLWCGIIFGIFGGISSLTTSALLHIFENLTNLLGTQIASFVSFLLLMGCLKIFQYLIIKIGNVEIVENKETGEIEISF